MCLLGNNGSGKTTLVNLLTGILEPEQGDSVLNFGGRTLSLKRNPKEFRSYVRLCQQDDFLFEELTIKEHIQLVSKLRGICEPTEIFRTVDEKAAEVGISQDLLDKPIKFVSPGARRKLSIAMALIGDAKLIIFDEPTSNLDLKSREKIWKLIRRIISQHHDRAILIST